MSEWRKLDELLRDPNAEEKWFVEVSEVIDGAAKQELLALEGWGDDAADEWWRDQIGAILARYEQEVGK